MQGYAFVPEGDEEALKEAVYSRGPVAVSLDASHRSFRFYSHGRHAHLFGPHISLDCCEDESVACMMVPNRGGSMCRTDA